MAQAHAGEQRFGKLTVRPAQRQLLVDGQPATVGARALDLLLALIERRERVVAKNELLDLVWPGLVVEENNLQVQISSLRKLLGPQVITTIPGRGYRFTATSPGAAAAERPISDAVLGRRAGDTLPERNSNLGEPATLLGRDADLAALVPLVTAHRAVTVVGAGGIGKTRLAQAAGHALRDVFTDGVWLVELAPLSDPQFVAAAAAQALGLSLPGHRPIFDELVEAL
ncbi:MAG TPA: winged helix-turn-helix domain-containing protein, partial [Methylibium sp.]